MLDEIEQRSGVRVLFAVEAGSRVWGTASEASDFDVRFVFCRPLATYASIADTAAASSTIEFKESVLDAHGWDARKALALAQGSTNGALFEWLRSPIVYADRWELLCSWRALVLERVVLPQLAKYYGGLLQRERKLCVGGRREIDDLKGYLHCARPALCAHWIMSKAEMAPLSLADLVQGAGVPDDARAYLESLLARKRQGALGSGAHSVALDRWLDEVEERAKKLAVPQLAAQPSLSLDHLLWSSVAAAFPARVLRVGVLMCGGDDVRDVHGRHFGNMIVDWLSAACGSAAPAPVTLECAGMWRVQHGELPTREQWSRCALIVCSGSAAAAYDTAVQWIDALADTLRAIMLDGPRLLGICFGHQLIAQVAGGVVVRNGAGVETGLRAVTLTDAGTQRLGGATALRFVMSHGDTVTRLPEGATRLAHNAYGEQMYSIGERVLCVQGHPEFSLEFGRQCAVARNGADLRDALETLDCAPSDSSAAAFGAHVVQWANPAMPMQ